MRFRIRNLKITIGFTFFAAAAFFLASDLYRNYFCCLLFSSLHEAGHLVAIKLTGCPVSEISLGSMGIKIVKKHSELSYKEECIVALSGPLVNALFVLIFLFVKEKNAFTFLSFNINLGLLIINMLPVGMLDGGRIVFALLSMHYEHAKVYKIMSVLEITVSLMLILTMIIALYKGIAGSSFVFFVISLVFITVFSLLSDKKYRAEKIF